VLDYRIFLKRNLLSIQISFFRKSQGFRKIVSSWFYSLNKRVKFAKSSGDKIPIIQVYKKASSSGILFSKPF